MYPLVEVPALVRHYAPHFEEVFSPAALIEFERYISGLIVSENKTVDGINRLFVVESRNQSSLNRLLTKSPFSLEKLNQEIRMELEKIKSALARRGEKEAVNKEEMLRRKVWLLLRQGNSEYYARNTAKAKKLYVKAVSAYKKLPEDAQREMYGSLKELYNLLNK